MFHGMQDFGQARPLDVVEQWKMSKLHSSFPVYPGFSCQFLKEDDQDVDRADGETAKQQQPLFRASTDADVN